MNEIPGLNLIPTEHQGTVAFVLLVLPYLTRAYHAIVTGGGIVGIYRAIFFGTNTPK